MTIVGTRDAGHTARVGLHDINLGTTVILVTSSCYVMFTEGPVGPKLIGRSKTYPPKDLIIWPYVRSKTVKGGAFGLRLAPISDEFWYC